MSPVDPNIPPPVTVEGRQADRLAAFERRLRQLEQYLQGGSVQQIPVVDTLPDAGREGRLVKLAGGAVYIDDGAAWTAL